MNKRCIRLGSGCLSAAKTVAIETRDGIMTPGKREEIFRDIDSLAIADSIFCLDVESAPA
jgi:hypothetical protein